MSDLVTPLQVFVPGRPRTKGSTRSFVSKTTGRMVTTGANPKTKAWQKAIALAAHCAGATKAPKGTAVSVSVVFCFKRPKNQYGTGRNAERLKPSAPTHLTSHQLGDLDKLTRALLDGLDGVCYVDDSQVSEISASKQWQREGQPEGALVTVMPARVRGEGAAL